ncbi:MAG: glycosyltransferase family 39 protein [Planctomycetota bacterium]
MPAAGPRPNIVAFIASSRWAQSLLLIAACALIYGFGLGSGGLTRSEGHRVGPAWELLDAAAEPGGLTAGDLFVPRLFEAVYVRKPPGTPWAIAVSSAQFGEHEWGARLPSALASTAMALVVMLFAWRWFGVPWGLAAGLAQAMSPWFWESGRSAEIEALHNLGAMLVCLGLIDRLVGRRETPALWPVLAIAVGLALALATKGPAAAPAFGGVLVGAGWLRWRTAQTERPPIGLGVLAVVIGAAAGAAVLWAEARLAIQLGQTGLPMVAQSPGAFLWNKPMQTLALGPTVWAMALPAALALLFPWGPDARAEAEANDDERAVRRLALGLALAWLTGVGVSVLAGISNPRYLLPVATLTAPMVAYVVRGVCLEAGGFGAKRRAIGRAMLLSNASMRTPGVLWVVLLAAGFVAYLTAVERGVRATSGREAGYAIAEVLPPGAVVLADAAVEARPEIMLYAERASGTDAGPRWLWAPSWDERVIASADAGWVLIRTDAGGDERPVLERLGVPADSTPGWSGRVHLFDLELHALPPR